MSGVTNLPRFPLGHMTMTPGARAALTSTGTNPFALLRRHRAGDWGAVSAADAAENELSVARGFRILSSYFLPDETRVWVITEADRSVTTILLPEEY